MELNWLNYFYEVAKTQSVTEASQRLRVSQPAVTKMVKQLEGSLGYPLFQKAGRKIQLTSDGQKLFQHCHSIFSSLQHIKKLKSEVDYQSEETIRAGASDNLATYIFPKVMERFGKKFPNIQWSVFSGVSADIKARLLSGEVDFGLCYTRLTFKEKALFDEREVGQVRFRIVYHPKFGKFKTIEQFNKADIPYIGSRYSDYLQSSAEHWVYHRMKLKVRPKYQTNSKDGQKRLAVAGLGFAIVPGFMVRSEIASGKLNELKTDQSLSDILLVTRKNERLSSSAEFFLKNHFEPALKQL